MSCLIHMVEFEPCIKSAHIQHIPHFGTQKQKSPVLSTETEQGVIITNTGLWGSRQLSWGEKLTSPKVSLCLGCQRLCLHQTQCPLAMQPSWVVRQRGRLAGVGVWYKSRGITRHVRLSPVSVSSSLECASWEPAVMSQAVGSLPSVGDPF